MNHLHLNLVSPDKKNGLKKLIQFIFLKQLLEFVLLTASLLAIIHLMGFWVVSQTLNDLAVSSLLVNREQTAANREVRRINNATRDITSSGEEYVELTPKLIELIRVIPPTITIQAVEIIRSNNSFLLAGIADTRQALLDFQKAMQGVNWLTNLSAPTSQLFTKTNVGFEIRGQLKGFMAPKKGEKPRVVEN